VIFIEDKVFELLTEMYSKMTEQFKEVNGKLDKKADKSDIIRLENDLQQKLMSYSMG
jgi:hypothetical protein